MTSLKTII